MRDALPPTPSDSLFEQAGLAARVKAKLARDGMTYREAAAHVPTSKATLHRVAAGKAPDVETFLRLARWLDAGAPAQSWECFSDPGYFDMWCVRQVGCKRFGEGFHVPSKAEAEALRDLLNGGAA